MRAVRFAALAQDDLLEAYGWFSVRSESLALRWLQAVDDTVARIAERPEVFQVVEGDV